MSIYIRGNVNGDVIESGAVKNETHYHYECEQKAEEKRGNVNNVNGDDVGRLTSAFFKDDAEDAVIVGKEKNTDNDKKQDFGIDMNSCVNDNNRILSVNRQAILDQLQDLTDRGDWVNSITSENIKTMLKAVLGIGEGLSPTNIKLSEVLWNLLESGRGDRVKTVWQNMVGYLDDRKLFRQKGSPALNKDFFGDDKGYTNIDKGRPSRENMSSGFREVLPLLDAYVPKSDKKA